MPSPFQANGAAVDPSKNAPLHTGRFFTGLWTQRSPLRDAATPYLYEKFYSATRYDSLIGGVNTEVTTRLTLARRPGSSVYVSVFAGGAVPEIHRLYEWRSFAGTLETIRVIADTATSVIEVTASTSATNGTGWFKQPGALTSSFQSVGNTLYWADGVSARKWIASAIIWAANTLIPAGAFIVTNMGNIEYTVNGGLTGAVEPIWPLTLGAATTDNDVVWIQKGFQVVAWGFAGPSTQPSVALVPPGPTVAAWQANTYYFPGLLAYDITSGGLVKLTTAGITASAEPTFSATIGTTTTDGTAVWTTVGNGASIFWTANLAHAVGDILRVFTTAEVGTPAFVYYQALSAGTSGSGAPQWLPGLSSAVLDGTILWQNIGDDVFTDSLRSKTLSAAQTITDASGGQQSIVAPGESGTSIPAFSDLVGGQTTDGTGGAVWQCSAIPPNSMTAWVWAYAFRNAVTNHVSTASPLSRALVPAPGFVPLLSGGGSTDLQVDTIRLYRTVQGENTLLFMADIPAPPPGASWSYYDNNPDSELNIEIQAQIADSNDPPPPTLTGLSYYLGRLWGFTGNVLRYSSGPDTLSGVGNEAWAPLNTFTFPSAGVRTWPTAIGLLAFTQSDVYIVQGQGTATAPFYATIFQEGVGLLNFDSFAVNGSTAYMMTTAQRLVSFDPGAGETEPGFPIGDILQSSYTMAKTRMEYHEGSSADTALYAADGTVGWYRLSTINAPESGQVWSPQAVLPGGVSALASIEISPGVKRLLYALYGGGPVLMRDATVYADNGAVYPANAIIGSIVLAEPGQIAGVQFITLDSIATGTQAIIGVLFNEIAGTFTTYLATRQDPTTLPPSKTLTGQRYYMSQNGQTPMCRHMQVQITWPAENAANELLAYTTFGFLKTEMAEK